MAFWLKVHNLWNFPKIKARATLTPKLDTVHKKQQIGKLSSRVSLSQFILENSSARAKVYHPSSMGVIW